MSMFDMIDDRAYKHQNDVYEYLVSSALARLFYILKDFGKRIAYTLMGNTQEKRRRVVDGVAKRAPFKKLTRESVSFRLSHL
jgi:hypothetical protein